MAGFLVDEDLPRSLARVLREAGFEAEDVRDIGLRGRTDEDIHNYSVDRRLTLLTADLGFSNPLLFPAGHHPGLMIVRFPNEVSTGEVTRAVVEAVRGLSDDEITDNVIIIEPGRIRLRRRR